MFYEVIPEGKVEALTYNHREPDSGGPASPLMPGQIVMVPVGKRSVPGIIIKKVVRPDFKTKSILKVLYSTPLPKHLLNVISFLHEYYLVPSGQAVSLILPRGVQKKRRKTEQMFGNINIRTAEEPTYSRDVSETSGMEWSGTGPRAKLQNEFCLPTTADSADSLISSYAKKKSVFSAFIQDRKTEQTTILPKIRLNEAQKNALEALYLAPGATKLLYGVTGSGKTNIYLKMAENALKRNFSSIILVPEIALTEQLVRVFTEMFGEQVILIHSQQTEAERHLTFERILDSETPVIVIGPRSALFAPVRKLGLIIIDEEHEGAYFQENSPKYSAIRVASAMAKLANCPLVLGSATPTVEDFYIASRQKSTIYLTKKAKTSAVKPKIHIVDFKNKDNFNRNRYFSNSLLGAIGDNLESGRQTMIFHNRRGSAPLTICDVCGEELLCPNCFLPLNLHADEYALHCHTCGFSITVPNECPRCGAPGLVHKGFGTKLLESELCKIFPNARIRRFDADNKKGEGMDSLYSVVKSGEIDILVGTQTIAKGLDLPKLATVGVVQADAGLSLPDYMAEERTFQLLTQVIGRVGRGHLNKAEVFIQTYRSDHPVLKYAAEEDYLGFYEYMTLKRRRAGFPPFRFVLKLEITMKTESLVLKKVRETVARLSQNEKLIVSPPQPGFHERTTKGYTWQIIIRSHSRKLLTEACKGLDRNFKITLDPPGLL